MATGLLEALGLPKAAVPGGRSAPAAPPPGSPAPPASDTPTARGWSLSPDGGTAPSKAPYLDLNSPDMKAALLRGIQEQAAKDKLEAQHVLAKVDKLLDDVGAYVAGMPADALQKASYAQVMAEVRKRFPEAAGLSQWVKDTSVKVPELKRKLPSSKALMSVVEKAIDVRGAQLGWALSTGKDARTLATDRLLAAYMSELPSGVTVAIGGDGVVRLSLDGAALSVKTPAGDVDAAADKGRSSISLKTDDYSIQVENEGWKDFDPQLRGQWKRIGDATSIVVKLKADRDKARLELEQKKKDGTEITGDVTADYEKKEAAFNLAWTKLQEKVTVIAKASEEKITASVAYLKKDKDDRDAVNAGADAEVDLKALKGKLNAYYKTPTLEAVLQVAAAADTVAARLEINAVKAGVVVTASFEKALDETKAAIEVMARDGKTKIAAELKQKADELTGKLKIVHEQKDLKLAAEMEKTLKEVRGSIEVEYRKGNTAVKGGASASTSGEVGGKVQIDIALKEGRAFQSSSEKLSFTANVSNQGYRFEVAFSMGEPVETASLQDLFKDADAQIKELYRMAGDKGIRSIDDAATLNVRMQEVMKPVKDAASKAKTLKKKSEISASFGFAIEGDWPVGGKATPPAATVGVTLRF